MNMKSMLLGLSLLLLSLPVYAIPPPDAVISIWQSLLQFLGVAAVFIGGAMLSLRQFFGVYIVGWKRVVFYLSLGVMAFWLLWLLLGGQIAKAKAAPVIQGERVAINELINRESNDWVREWKLETIGAMGWELNLARQSRELPDHTPSIVQSFSPKRLNQLIKGQSNHLYLLDIREASERSRFGIPANASARYGDIAGNIIPANLPKNTVIIVLCHSGLRGYLGASLLKAAGYAQAAFLQGGLAAWEKQKLSIRGNADYSTKKRWLPGAKESARLKTLKVQVDAEGSKLVHGLSNLIKLPYETATTQDLERFMSITTGVPVLLVCNTYGGCFHSTNMAWFIEHRGGKVMGIYDETGEHMASFFD